MRTLLRGKSGISDVLMFECKINGPDHGANQEDIGKNRLMLKTLANLREVQRQRNWNNLARLLFTHEDTKGRKMFGDYTRAYPLRSSWVLLITPMGFTDAPLNPMGFLWDTHRYIHHMGMAKPMGCRLLADPAWVRGHAPKHLTQVFSMCCST